MADPASMAPSSNGARMGPPPTVADMRIWWCVGGSTERRRCVNGLSGLCEWVQQAHRWARHIFIFVNLFTDMPATINLGLCKRRKGGELYACLQ